MTTKHILDQSMHGTDAHVDESGAEQSQQAEDASRQLLAKARYDAFGLMTEARNEAETILDEAGAEAAGARTAAELTATMTVESAAAEAAEIIESGREEAAAIIASAHRTAGEEVSLGDGDQLEAEHKALSDRVSTLRSLAAQLEDRFAALATTAGASTHEATPEPTMETTVEVTPTLQTSTAPEEISPAIDYSPSADPQPKTAQESSPAERDNRESFYNRRSAKLPRLGEDSGRSVLNMTRMMRETLDGD
jgi:hypothetical protein